MDENKRIEVLGKLGRCSETVCELAVLLERPISLSNTEMCRLLAVVRVTIDTFADVVSTLPLSPKDAASPPQIHPSDTP